MHYCCLLTLSFFSIVAAHLNAPIFPSCTKASQLALRGGGPPAGDASAVGLTEKRQTREQQLEAEVQWLKTQLAEITGSDTSSGIKSLGVSPSSGVKVLNLAVAEAKPPLLQNPEVDVHNIAKFNNWDHRECCVGNAQQWRDFMAEFLKEEKDDIPKIIHQIWIGPKQPPIIWCD